MGKPAPIPPVPLTAVLVPAAATAANNVPADQARLERLFGQPVVVSQAALPMKQRSKRRVKVLVGLAAGLMLTTAAAVKFLTSAYPPGRTDLVTHAVAYEKLQVTIVERGALEAAENKEIVCQVKAGSKGANGATMIKWVIEDGTPVKRGQLIMELDDSGFYDQLKTEEIALDQAHAAWIQAEENYKIVASQNESDLATARVVRDLAKIDLEKYLKGDYQQQLKDIEGRAFMAESELEMRRDRAAWTERMVRRRYLTAAQSQSEQSLLQGAEIARNKIVEERRVLDTYAYVRTKTDLENRWEEAKRALDRVRKHATAKEVQALTERQTRRFVYEKELAHYREIEAEIRKCVIAAPGDGLVVYYVSEQARSGSGSQQSILAQGEPVREGQKLMCIPDLSHMVVNTRVHEAMMARIKGDEYERTGFCDSIRAALMTAPCAWSRLTVQAGFYELDDHFQDKERRKIRDGQQALIRVDAFPNRVLHGHVMHVATVASQQDWWMGDVKVYQTLVSIDEPLDGLKPGMSAEVTVLVGESHEHVLAVPAQAVYGTADVGSSRKCCVANGGMPEERDITVGVSNEKMVEVVSGLEEDDVVVLNPRTLLGQRGRDKASP